VPTVPAAVPIGLRDVGLGLLGVAPADVVAEVVVPASSDRVAGVAADAGTGAKASA
jgi:hypothetical protein